MTKIYYKTELEKFTRKGEEYLDQDTKLSMQGFCDWLGITRRTLSKYRQRNEEWRKCIDYFHISIKSVEGMKRIQSKLLTMERKLERQKQKQIKEEQEELNREFNSW